MSIYSGMGVMEKVQVSDGNGDETNDFHAAVGRGQSVELGEHG